MLKSVSKPGFALRASSIEHNQKVGSKYKIFLCKYLKNFNPSLKNNCLVILNGKNEVYFFPLETDTCFIQR